MRLDRYPHGNPAIVPHQTIRDIWQELTINPRKTVRTLASEFGLANTKTQAVIAHLKSLGYISKDKNGKRTVIVPMINMVALPEQTQGRIRRF